MRVVCLLLALLCLDGTVAFADTADRETVARLFLQGRLRELEVVATDDAWTQFAVFVRDHYWRRSSDPLPELTDKDDLLSRRRNWIIRRQTGDAGPYPTADNDPTPVLTALILDREARERGGEVASHGDPGPFSELQLDGAASVALKVGLDLLSVHHAFEANAEDEASASKADALAKRNAWIGIGAVLLLLFATVLFGKRWLAPKTD